MSVSPPVSPSMREGMYRAYMEFFETAERKRRWNPWDDIPWEDLEGREPTPGDEDTAVIVESFCGVELYVPDYTLNGFNLTREIFGHAWFQACWGYEESKHALVFREYLTRSDLRSEAEYDAYEAKIRSKTWTLPFPTRRQMSCYGALQEIATYLIYSHQRRKYRQEGNRVLERIFYLVARDEAAHAGFYRRALELAMAEDRDGTLEDLARVVAGFEMPGVRLLREFGSRLSVEGVGISSRTFFEHGLLPTLRFMGVSRPELISTMREIRRRDAAPLRAAADSPSMAAQA